MPRESVRVTRQEAARDQSSTCFAFNSPPPFLHHRHSRETSLGLVLDLAVRRVAGARASARPPASRPFASLRRLSRLPHPRRFGFGARCNSLMDRGWLTRLLIILSKGAAHVI